MAKRSSVDQGLSKGSTGSGYRGNESVLQVPDVQALFPTLEAEKGERGLS